MSAASTTVAAVSHPEPRGFAQLVYHPPSGHFLLFGGEANQRFSYEETWSYDVMANEWTDLDPEVQPRRAGGETIVYDSESDRFIAYFNTRLSDTAPSGLEPMSETWIYDLTDSAWSLAGP